jgi:hypothetical protein
MPHERQERNFVDNEPRIVEKLLGKLWIVDFNSPDLSQILDFEERDW